MKSSTQEVAGIARKDLQGEGRLECQQGQCHPSIWDLVGTTGRAHFLGQTWGSRPAGCLRKKQSPKLASRAGATYSLGKRVAYWISWVRELLSQPALEQTPFMPGTVEKL